MQRFVLAVAVAPLAACFLEGKVNFGAPGADGGSTSGATSADGGPTNGATSGGSADGGAQNNHGSSGAAAVCQDSPQPIAPLAAPSWVPVQTSGPAPRAGHSLTFDAGRNVTVLYGGGPGNGPGTGAATAETWEYRASTQLGVAGTWTLATPAQSPPPLTGHAAAYDVARGLTVIFGGYDGVRARDETWEYDGRRWTASTAFGPGAISHLAMAYDESRRVAVLCCLFGGTDTWEYDGAKWSPTSSSLDPAMHAFPSMAYDARRSRIVLFGDKHTSETWEYASGAWCRRSTATSPPPTVVAAMAFDAGRGMTVLFGGVAFGSGGAAASSDTWEYDGVDWRRSATPTSPESRNGHAMAYDSVRGKIVMFGGMNAAGVPLGDTLEY